MKNEVVEVSIRGVMPTANGCALFLGNEEKSFVIYIDQAIGSSISMAINEVPKERPLTHDLMDSIFRGFEINLQRVIINDASEGTFFARIILEMNNEIVKKIIEIDARPSDSVNLAVLQSAPIFVARKVFEDVEDMSGVLEKILQQEEEEMGGDFDFPEGGDDEDEDEPNPF